MNLKGIEERLEGLYRRHVSEQGAISVTRMPGDASNRSYYRLVSGEQSVIAMVLAEGDAHKAAEEISNDGGVIVELPFINVLRFLERNGLPVPRLIYDGQSEGVLLLEDLGDLTLLEYAAKASAEELEGVYAKAVDRLLDFQKAGRDDRDEAFIGFRRRFDAELLYWEFQHFLEYGVEKKGIAVSPEDNAALAQTFRTLSERIVGMPQVLVHRDYHSRNLMVVGADELAVIDFQDALLGPVPYDLASLLRDSYITLDGGMVDRLIDRYREGAAELELGKWGRDEFREWFDIVSVHRNLKAAGRFDFIDMVKGNPKFLADIPCTLAYVRGNLARHESLAGLRVLGRYVEALS